MKFDENGEYCLRKEMTLDEFLGKAYGDSVELFVLVQVNEFGDEIFLSLPVQKIERLVSGFDVLSVEESGDRFGVSSLILGVSL